MNALKQRWQSGCLGKALIIGVVLFACVVCGVIGTAVQGPDGAKPTTQPTEIAAAKSAETKATEVATAKPTKAPTKAPQPTDTPGPTDTPAPTNTPMPTDTPVPPTNTPEPQAALQAAVVAALSNGNRDVPRVTDVYLGKDTITVSWAINDNFTEGFIKGGARGDVRNILRAIKASGAPFDMVDLTGSFPMVDVYGNAEETNVVNLVYTKKTFDKLNLDNILLESTIYEAADSASINPAFQGE